MCVRALSSLSYVSWHRQAGSPPPPPPRKPLAGDMVLLKHISKEHGGIPIHLHFRNHEPADFGQLALVCGALVKEHDGSGCDSE